MQVINRRQMYQQIDSNVELFFPIKIRYDNVTGFLADTLEVVFCFFFINVFIGLLRNP